MPRFAAKTSGARSPGHMKSTPKSRPTRSATSTKPPDAILNRAVPSAALLFSRGLQATMGHRVANALWHKGAELPALALKAACGRTFGTDIHPAAEIGAGFWLDHGIGFVAGETTVIGEDVSIWHNVTLGSTFNTPGANRHPKIEQGAIIGAGALVLGNITIGTHANIGASAIVLNDGPSGRVVTGPARVSFLQGDAPS